MKSAVATTGLRLHYTNELRENEGGILITGVAPSTLHFIPPYQKEYKTAGYCSLNCTQEVSTSQHFSLFKIYVNNSQVVTFFLSYASNFIKKTIICTGIIDII